MQCMYNVDGSSSCLCVLVAAGGSVATMDAYSGISGLHTHTYTHTHIHIITRTGVRSNVQGLTHSDTVCVASIFLRSCTTSHSRAYRCQAAGEGWYLRARCLTESAQLSSVPQGAGATGTGSAHSSHAPRLVDVHRRSRSRLPFPPPPPWAFQRLVRASSSLLKSCGRGERTMGLSASILKSLWGPERGECWL